MIKHTVKKRDIRIIENLFSIFLIRLDHNSCFYHVIKSIFLERIICDWVSVIGMEFELSVFSRILAEEICLYSLCTHSVQNTKLRTNTGLSLSTQNAQLVALCVCACNTVHIYFFPLFLHSLRFINRIAKKHKTKGALC